MKKKIMIADDDYEFVETLREYLEDSGFDTVCAYEGVRVVEAANREHPDLIILDWKMPVGKGPVVLQALSEKYDTKEIPVIILTGIDEIGMEEFALKFGVKAFIRKPFEPQRLLQKIKEIVG